VSAAGVYVDGVARDGSGEVRAIVDPASGEPVGEVREATPADVAEATTAARRAFDDWSSRTPGERARVLLRLADLVEADADELTRLEVEETGKPRAVFADGELPFAADNLRFFAGSARSLEGTASEQEVRGRVLADTGNAKHPREAVSTPTGRSPRPRKSRAGVTQQRDRGGLSR